MILLLFINDLGFTDKEVNMIVEVDVGLGPQYLRVETATIPMDLLATLILWSDSQHMPNP